MDISSRSGREIAKALGEGGEEILKSQTRLIPSIPLKDQYYWHRLAIQSSPPDTPHDELSRRVCFMFFAVMNTYISAPLLASMLLARQMTFAALNPLSYGLLMGYLITFQCKESQYMYIVQVHQTLMLILPIWLQFEIGGMIHSGCVFLGSFLCPIGAALFCPNVAWVWFTLYVILISTTIAYESRWAYPLPSIETMLFIMNFCGVVIISFCGALFVAERFEIEYKRSEKLLGNILPQSIITRLKDDAISDTSQREMGTTYSIIEHYDGVSILFAKLVDFTAISNQYHPNFIIGMYLRDVFIAWDQLCAEKDSVENIKTIAHACMIVGGLDRVQREEIISNDVAAEMVLLGLEMQVALDKVNEKYHMNIKCQIGVHTGPVIAGVIGVNKFAFDVWGDSVNTASRMESHGVPGYLQMSSETYHQVKAELYEFDIQCRGEIEVKGKGTMTTYLILLPEATTSSTTSTSTSNLNNSSTTSSTSNIQIPSQNNSSKQNNSSSNATTTKTKLNPQKHVSKSNISSTECTCKPKINPQKHASKSINKSSTNSTTELNPQQNVSKSNNSSTNESTK